MAACADVEKISESEPAIKDATRPGSGDQGKSFGTGKEDCFTGCSQIDGDVPIHHARIYPRLRRCSICTLPPPCRHRTIKVAAAELKEELASYPENPGAEPCHEFWATGCCHSMQKWKRCHFAHPSFKKDSCIVFLHEVMTSDDEHCDVDDRKRESAWASPSKERKKAKPRRPSLMKRLPSSSFAHPVFEKPAPLSCSICRIGLPCKSHFAKSPFADKGGGEAKEYERKLQRAKDFSENRCPLCTLPLPCQHFVTDNALKRARKNNEIHASRYPLTPGAPYCVRFQRMGSCPCFDSLGVCLFWHPKIYANKLRNLDALPVSPHLKVVDQNRQASVKRSTGLRKTLSVFSKIGEICGVGAGIAEYNPGLNKKSQLHGFDGLPGEHRSSGGHSFSSKSNIAVLRAMYVQDKANVSKALRRSEGKSRPKIEEQWAFPSPPSSRLPMAEATNESFKERLLSDRLKSKRELRLEARDLEWREENDKKFKTLKGRQHFARKLWLEGGKQEGWRALR